MSSGWRSEPVRHSLASNGIETTSKGIKEYTLEEYSDNQSVSIPKEWILDWYEHARYLYNNYDGDDSYVRMELRKLVRDIREVIIQSDELELVGEEELDSEVKQLDWSLRDGYPAKEEQK